MAKSKIRNTEGGVYRCTWRKLSKGIALECLKPATQTTAGTIEEALDLLHTQVSDLTGDGEPYLQFIPVLPVNRRVRHYYEPAYFAIGHNELVPWEADIKTLYTGGICRRCKAGIGKRTGVRRQLKKAPTKDFAGFLGDRNLRYLYSEKFLEHILPCVRRKIRCIPVGTEGLRTTKRFFEIDFDPEYPAVVPRGADVIGGGRCPKCGSYVLSIAAMRFSRRRLQYIERGFEERPVLLLGNGVTREFALNEELFAEISRDKALKGFVADPVIILEPNQILHTYQLPSLP